MMKIKIIFFFFLEPVELKKTPKKLFLVIMLQKKTRTTTKKHNTQATQNNNNKCFVSGNVSLDLPHDQNGIRTKTGQIPGQEGCPESKVSKNVIVLLYILYV